MSARTIAEQRDIAYAAIAAGADASDEIGNIPRDVVVAVSVPLLRTKPHLRQHQQAWAVELAKEGVLQEFTLQQLWQYLRHHSRSILATVDNIGAGTGPDPQNILPATMEFMALDYNDYRAGGEEFSLEQDVATAVDCYPKPSI
jgi:hypothetical protein